MSKEDSTEGSTEGSLEGSTGESIEGSTEGSTDGSTDDSANYSTDDSTEDSKGGSAERSISGQKTCGAPGYMRSLPVSGQTMTSPFFPANYPNNFKRKRTIEAPKGNFINIQFTDFEVDTLYDGDFVQITDGDGTFLGHFGARHQLTMENATFNVSSNTETVHVLFRTDQSHTRSGWRLVWSEWILSLSEVNPNPNPGFSSLLDRVQPLSGFMTSPNYPRPYPNKLDIVQKIEVPEDFKIWIRFSDFHLCNERGMYKTCHDTLSMMQFHPYIKVWGQLGLPRGYLGLSREMISDSNKVEIHFHTDTAACMYTCRQEHRGWSLNWG